MKKLNKRQLIKLIKKIISESRSYYSLPNIPILNRHPSDETAKLHFWSDVVRYLEADSAGFLRDAKMAARLDQPYEGIPNESHPDYPGSDSW